MKLVMYTILYCVLCQVSFKLVNIKKSEFQLKSYSGIASLMLIILQVKNISKLFFPFWTVSPELGYLEFYHHANLRTITVNFCREVNQIVKLLKRISWLKHTYYKHIFFPSTHLETLKTRYKKGAKLYSQFTVILEKGVWKNVQSNFCKLIIVR